MKTAKPKRRPFVRPWVWAVSVGMAASFMVVWSIMVWGPDSNLGPPVAVIAAIVFGVMGSVLGLVLGRLAWFFRMDARHEPWAIGVASVLAAVVCGYLTAPEPWWCGVVMEGEILLVESPARRLSESLESWDRLLKEEPSKYSPRPGWRQESESMVEEQGGSVLTLRVLRMWDITRGQAPWDRGELDAVLKESDSEVDERVYFAKRDSDAYDLHRVGETHLYSLRREAPHEKPSPILSTLLRLYILDEVPAARLELLDL